MELDITDGKITQIDTVNGGPYTEVDYDLGTTTKGNFFAAIGKKNKGYLVLIPVASVTAIHMEVGHAEQQDTSKDKA
jgi:hypothetical protein